MPSTSLTQIEPSGSRSIRAPRQDRSRRTLDHLLDATETLLEQRPLDDITVRDIVRRARASTGSFYARFEDKDACVAATLERFLRAGTLAAGSAARPPRLGRPPFVLLMRSAVRTHRSHRGLLRALSAYIGLHPRSLTARLGADASAASRGA